MQTITEIDLTLTTKNDNRGPQGFESRLLGEREGFAYHLDTYLKELLNSCSIDIVSMRINEVRGDERFNLVFQYRESPPPTTEEMPSDNMYHVKYTLSRGIWEIIESSRILGFKEETISHDPKNWWVAPKANDFKGGE